MSQFKIGDVVEFEYFDGIGNPHHVTGVITKLDGINATVRPNGMKWIELTHPISLIHPYSWESAEYKR